MIPKTIHYCWFGHASMPVLAKRCMASWRKYCPDYEIIEWNEDNYDIESAPLYVRQAYEKGKWAFVTDYVRLWVVWNQGGVYLDTDVELIKPLDSFLSYSAFFGFEDNNLIATGLGFGAEKGSSVLQMLMNDYANIPFVLPDGSLDLLSCPHRNTKTLTSLAHKQENRFQVLPENIAFFPTSVFCPLSYFTGEKNITSDTVSIHWYSASWLPKQQRKKHERSIRKNRILRPIKDAIKIVFGERISGVLKIIVYGKKDDNK